MAGLSLLVLSLALVLKPDTACSHLVQDVAEFLNKKIDFVGHDNGFRSHIRALERDFKELNELDHDSKNHQHVQNVITSLNSALTVMRRVEDHIVSLAKTSKTDVSGLENFLNQFKSQVDHDLSTDYTYKQLMITVGSLITDSDETMKKEIKEITRAESMMNTAKSEMTILTTLLEIHEKKEKQAEREGTARTLISAGLSIAAWAFGYEDVASKIGDRAFENVGNLLDVYDHKEKFLRVEQNILDCFQYFKDELVQIEKEDVAMRKLRDDYAVVRVDWDEGYHQEDLVDVAEDQQDWEIDVMANIRSLKRSVTNFLSSSANW